MTTKQTQQMHACVIGDPIAHSLSPLLHGAWIKAANINAKYARRHATKKEFNQAVKDCFSDPRFVGMNVTLPHKEAAKKIADCIDDTVKQAGAANLLTRKNGQLYARNTDIEGFSAPLLKARTVQHWKNTNIVILGAGGAARAALIGALSLKPGRIQIINRTQARAQVLAEGFGDKVEALDWSKREEALADASLLVNASSAGMTGKPPLDLSLQHISGDALVYDLIYTPQMTPLLCDAKAKGCAILGGLDMLIAQAKPSFEAFFGVPPPQHTDVKGLLLQALGEVS